MARVAGDSMLAPVVPLALFGIASAGAILACDLIQPPREKSREAGSFIGHTLAASFVILGAHRFYLSAGIPVIYPFTGIKVLSLCLALATPPPTLAAWLCFGILGFAPVLQSMYWTEAQRMQFAGVEPWITLGFTLFTLSLWLSRWYLQKSYHRMLWLESRTRSLEDLAHLLLSARHLQNSALQVIEGHAGLIEHEFPEAKRHTVPIQRAINQIVRLTSALEVYDDRAVWGSFVPPKDHREFELRLLNFKNEKHAPAPEF